MFPIFLSFSKAVSTRKKINNNNNDDDSGNKEKRYASSFFFSSNVEIFFGRKSDTRDNLVMYYFKPRGHQGLMDSTASISSDCQNVRGVGSEDKYLNTGFVIEDTVLDSFKSRADKG